MKVYFLLTNSSEAHTIPRVAMSIDDIPITWTYLATIQNPCIYHSLFRLYDHFSTFASLSAFDFMAE